MAAINTIFSVIYSDLVESPWLYIKIYIFSHGLQNHFLRTIIYTHIPAQ